MVGILFWVAFLIFMNASLLLIMLYFAHGTKEKASKTGFWIMIFVYIANIATLIGGITR